MRVFFEEVTENGGKKTYIIGRYASTQIHVWSINIGVDFNNSCLARFEPDLCDTIYELQMYMYKYRIMYSTYSVHVLAVSIRISIYSARIILYSIVHVHVTYTHKHNVR